MTGEMDGRVAIVTGGAAGIGRAVATDLGAAGAQVVVADRAGADEAAADLGAKGIRAIGVTVDVSDEEQTARMVEVAAERLGPVDVLVNNAGIFTALTPKPLTEIDVAEWRRVMDVNVLGVFLCTRAVVPSMIANGGGRIVNIASTTPFKGVAHLLHYVASKGAVVAMTRAGANELGRHGILVNAVAPGFTVSDGVLQRDGDALDGMRNSAAGKRALGREETPDDVVGAVRFLCGPSSGFVTGQTLVVDGGAYFH